MTSAPEHDATPPSDRVEHTCPDWLGRALDSAASQMSPPIDDGITSLPTTYNLRPPACLACRRRKVRCDKKLPCINCKRARIHCSFPTSKTFRQYHPDYPEEEVISQREHELMGKLERLEGVVKALGSKVKAGSGPKVHISCSLVNGTFANNSVPKLVRKDQVELDETLRQRSGLSVQSPSDACRTSPQDTFNAWSETKNSDDEELNFLNINLTSQGSLPLGAYPADPSNLLLPCRPVDAKLTGQNPLPCQIAFLWLTYQENIEPFIKVLHIPSIEPVMRCARKNRFTLTPEQQALAFAIYFAAIASLRTEEITTNFGTTKTDLLSRYQFAFEQALSGAKFLHTANITILQALSIFLAAIRPHCELVYCWSLTGLLIRLAQGMGLHRDGTYLGQTPFEAEIRRRIWWQILILDVRCAEELGTDLIVDTASYDAVMPSNINDVDIEPNVSQLPAQREGASDCAVVLIRYEILALNRAVQHASSTLEFKFEPENNALKISNLDDREQILAKACQRIEERFFKHVWNEKIEPVYWMAVLIARLITAKISLVMYQPKLFPGSDEMAGDEFHHRFYTAAVEVMEYSVILRDEDQFSPYRWLGTTYTNWHALSHYLIEACRHPWTSLAERGWLALNRNGNLGSFLRGRGHVALIQPLEKLRARVASHRTHEMARLRTNPEEVPRLTESEPVDSVKACKGSVLHADNMMKLTRDTWRMMMLPNSRRTISQLKAFTTANFDQGVSMELSNVAARDVSPLAQNEIEELVLGQNLDNLDDDRDVDMLLENLDWEAWTHSMH